MRLVALLLAVLAIGMALNSMPEMETSLTPEYQHDIYVEEPAYSAQVYPVEPERYNGYEVLERLNENDVCLLINGVPTWVTIMPEPENWDPIVNWNVFDSIWDNAVG